MQHPEIFSRLARRARHLRATRLPSADQWLMQRIGSELLERLEGVRTPLHSVLILGLPDQLLIDALCRRGMAVLVAGPGGKNRAVICEEDRLPFAERTMDLVLAVGGLDTVNDLPGALALIRRTLRPDGLFLGGMMAAGSLSALRTAIAEGGRGNVARIHPQIDVRSTGDLLSRAGFSLPVADTETVAARYASFSDLARDLRANGLTNSLRIRHALTAGEIASIDQAFPRDASGRFEEQFAIAYLTGWARP
jgi:SAM-dependent methyltransferase